MKLLIWLIVIAVAAVLAAFAINNYHTVPLDLWPLPYAEVKVAVFVLVLVAAFLGFVAGGIVAWFGGAAQRRRGRDRDRERARALAETRRELADTRAKLPAPPPARA